MEIETHLGLHEIPKRTMELTRINTAIKQLLANLDTFIDNTEKSVPTGRDSYEIRRSNIGTITEGTGYEIRLERSLWSKYHESGASEKISFLPTCTGIAGYSVALFDGKEQKGWGEIDLLGISNKGMRIPIELKQDTGDNILKMIVQVAAYGIAVRKVWNLPNSAFQRDWKSIIPGQSLPAQIDKMECVGLATKAYWERAFGQPGTQRKAGQVFHDSWKPIQELLKALDNAGITVSFAEVILAPQLPTIASCKSVNLPMTS